IYPAYYFRNLSDAIISETSDNPDGYLVACFSDDPLVGMLREHASKPVIGIFKASVVDAVALGQPLGIVTTGRYYPEACTSCEMIKILGSASAVSAALPSACRAPG
ncbi:hypothetical protein FKP32DRAFT_1700792, partial [Trametes sanguinea]